jgi:hypothetical protein
MLRAASLLLAAASVTSCAATEVTVVLRLPDSADDVGRIEVSILSDCGSVAPPAAPSSPILRTDDVIGRELTRWRLDPGRYGVYARAFRADCAVVAAACRDFDLGDDSGGEVELALVDVPPAGCAAPEVCVDFGCVEPGLLDFDSDGVIDELDNCPSSANPDQDDQDGDGMGDACDGDCDETADCSTCSACADDGPCGPTTSVCNESAACQTFDSCIEPCATSQCYVECALANPDGADAWLAAARCRYCDACSTACDDELTAAEAILVCASR